VLCTQLELYSIARDCSAFEVGVKVADAPIIVSAATRIPISKLGGLQRLEHFEYTHEGTEATVSTAL
jgi:hypothetical protein